MPAAPPTADDAPPGRSRDWRLIIAAAAVMVTNAAVFVYLWPATSAAGAGAHLGDHLLHRYPFIGIVVPLAVCAMYHDYRYARPHLAAMARRAPPPPRHALDSCIGTALCTAAACIAIFVLAYWVQSPRAVAADGVA